MQKISLLETTSEELLLYIRNSLAKLEYVNDDDFIRSNVRGTVTMIDQWFNYQQDKKLGIVNMKPQPYEPDQG